jgi:hypothetical protein
MDRGKVTEWTEDGLPLIMTGTHIDITESKELELSIREREESYRVLLETSFDIIYRIDQEGKIKYVSQAWNTLLVLLITNVVPLLLGTFAGTCSLNLPQKGRKAGHDCLWAVA